MTGADGATGRAGRDHGKSRPAFSFMVRVGHVSANPFSVTLQADEKECLALARAWDVLRVEKLQAELQVMRWKRDGVRVKGVVKAVIVQACVVTLEPVSQLIDEELDQCFVPEGSKLARHDRDEGGEWVFDPHDPDPPDVFSGDAIDVGALVGEHVALAIEPYPRKPGVAFETAADSMDLEPEKPATPFAALARLKDKKHS